MQEVELEFRAMNTDVRTVVVSSARRRTEAERALEEVEALFREMEATLSRFLPDSELSRLNASPPQPFHASSTLFEVVAAALAAAKETRGLFDPTILHALAGIGYDRSFELLGRAGGEDVPVSPPPERAAPGCWEAVRMDRSARTITLPPGCGIDLGGIGKGWTVDQAARRLKPFTNFVVDAGGDIAAHGVQGNGERWSVGVEDPLDPQRDLMILDVEDAAIATSSTTRRRWEWAGVPRHHLIDPRTGAPVDNEVKSVTVIAESVAHAEVMAKAVLMMGPEEGLRFLNNRPDSAGLLVLGSGELVLSDRLKEGRYVA